MTNTIFKIVVVLILLSAFVDGLLGIGIFAICVTGFGLLCAIVLFYVIKKIMLLLWSYVKIIYSYCKSHPQRVRWTLFFVYTIFVIAPILYDLSSLLKWSSLKNHLYITVLGVILVLHIFYSCINNIHLHYNNYKQMYGFQNIFKIWGSKNKEFSLWDFIWNSYEVNKDSLFWLRKFIMFFCYPCIFISYAICLTSQWNKIFNVVSFASLFIAIYSIWYAVNLKKKQHRDPELPLGTMTKLTPTDKEAKNRSNQQWGD